MGRWAGLPVSCGGAGQHACLPLTRSSRPSKASRASTGPATWHAASHERCKEPSARICTTRQHYKERVCSAAAGHRLWVLLHGSALLTVMVSEPT